MAEHLGPPVDPKKVAKWERRREAARLLFIDKQPFAALGVLAANQKPHGIGETTAYDQKGRPTSVRWASGGQEALTATENGYNTMQFWANVLVDYAKSNDKDAGKRLRATIKRRKRIQREARMKEFFSQNKSKELGYGHKGTPAYVTRERMMRNFGLNDEQQPAQQEEPQQPIPEPRRAREDQEGTKREPIFAHAKEQRVPEQPEAQSESNPLRDGIDISFDEKDAGRERDVFVGFGGDRDMIDLVEGPDGIYISRDELYRDRDDRDGR